MEDHPVSLNSSDLLSIKLWIEELENLQFLDWLN